MHAATASEDVRDQQLADDDVLSVLVSANRPGAFQLLDDGDDDSAAGDCTS